MRSPRTRTTGSSVLPGIVAPRPLVCCPSASERSTCTTSAGRRIGQKAPDRVRRGSDDQSSPADRPVPDFCALNRIGGGRGRSGTTGEPRAGGAQRGGHEQLRARRRPAGGRGGDRVRRGGRPGRAGRGGGAG